MNYIVIFKIVNGYVFEFPQFYPQTHLQTAYLSYLQSLPFLKVIKTG